MSSVSLSVNSDYQSVREKLIEAEIELSKLKTFRTDADPQVQDLRLQRDELRKRLQGYVKQAAGRTTIDTTVGNNAGRTDLIQELILAETEAQSSESRSRKISQ